MISPTASNLTNFGKDASRMESGPESPMTESERPAEIPPGPRPWQLHALRGPAVVRVGERVWPTDLRLWLDRILQGTQAALERILRRPAQLRLAAHLPNAATRPAPVFGIVFTLPGFQREAVLALDLAAARAVADAISKELAQLRGDGHLTDTELGLLEYLTLACADLLEQNLSVTGFAFVRFVGPAEIEKTLQTAPPQTLDIELSVGGRAGLLRLALEEFDRNYVAPEFQEYMPAETAADDSWLTTPIELYLALPPITLTSQEFKAMQPGDVVLLGCSRLESFATDCAIVTGNGWRLSAAQLLSDSLGLVSVRCDALRPTVDEAWAVEPSGNALVARPRLGNISRSLEQLGRWQSGDVIDFLKDSNAPVELWIGATRIGAGEFALVEGELGIRLLELTPPGQGA